MASFIGSKYWRKLFLMYKTLDPLTLLSSKHCCTISSKCNFVATVLPWLRVIELHGLNIRGDPTPQSYMVLANLLEITTDASSVQHNNNPQLFGDRSWLCTLVTFGRCAIEDIFAPVSITSLTAMRMREVATIQ